MTEDINELFDAPIVTEEAVEDIKLCRREFSAFLNTLSSLSHGDSREFSIVKTKLEEASFFMNKAIAKNNLDK